MPRKIYILNIIIVTLLFIYGCQADLSQETNSPIVFLDVNIIPMDSENILEHQTVIIRDGKINKIGPFQKTSIPKNSYQIDAKNKFLMPGLIDMHAHVEHEDALILFLANGVTTVRNLWGYPKHLIWKESILKGELEGPTIYTAGPIIDGPPGVWDHSVVFDEAEKAEQLVVEQKEKGFDFIKVYYLQKHPFYALIDAAQKYNIPVIGHVSDAVGLEGVLTSGQYSIEHLDGYWMPLESESSPYRDKFDYHSYIMKWNYIDDAKMPAVAELTKSSGIWNCPTLVVYQHNASPAEADSFYALPEMEYMDPVSLASWDPTKYFVTMSLTKEEWGAEKKMYPTLVKLTGYLYKAGAKLLLGTDTPNPFIVPGFSIHTELQNFIKAGMSPYEAIKTGTYNAAECLGGLDRFGTIHTGKQADLILLEDNPLLDVANIKRRSGVLIRGKWFPEEKLQNMLEEITSSYSPPENRFEDTPAIDSKYKSVLQDKFELTYNGVPFGEERYELFLKENGNYKLISQTVTDRPYTTKTFVEMTVDQSYNCTDIEYKNETSTGQNILKYTRSDDSLKITGKLEPNEQVLKNCSISGDELISPPASSVCVSSVPVFASYLQVVRKLQPLNVGDSLMIVNRTVQLDYPYEIKEEYFNVKRIADSEKKTLTDIIPVCLYKFIVSSPNTSVNSLLTTDLEGRLISLEIEQQIGILSFSLISHKKGIIIR